jgi:hypothetical protein
MQKLCKSAFLLHPYPANFYLRLARPTCVTLNNNMLELKQISYSESASITAIGNFFKFLTAIYLDEATVKWPPEGGWPSVTVNAFKSLNKSERVVSLLRQIPYMHDLGRSDDKELPQGAPEANFCDWTQYAESSGHRSSTQVNEWKLLTEGSVWERTTPDIIGLLVAGQDDSAPILLDTKYGIAYWPGCPDQIRHETRQEQVQDDYDAWASKEEADWRGDSPAWTITDFFAMLQEQSEQLRFIPINDRQVIDSYSEYSDDGEMEPMLQGIYREHGWPNLEDYRKEECIQAVEQALAEKYPDFELY